MKFWVKNILFISYLLSLILLPNFCFAKYTANDISSFVSDVNKGVGADTVDYKTFTAKIVQGGLGVVGLVFFILIFYGGYLWLAARGKDEDIKKAQDTIVAAIIGLMVIVGSYALTNLVFTRLVGGSTTKQPKTATSGETAGTAAKPQGCCLNEAQTPGFWYNAGGKTWFYSINDKDTCAIEGNTCDDIDGICGSVEGQHWSWTPDVDNYAVCGEMANKLEEN